MLSIDKDNHYYCKITRYIDKQISYDDVYSYEEVETITLSGKELLDQFFKLKDEYPKLNNIDIDTNEQTIKADLGEDKYGEWIRVSIEIHCVEYEEELPI